MRGIKMENRIKKLKTQIKDLKEEISGLEDAIYDLEYNAEDFTIRSEASEHEEKILDWLRRHVFNKVEHCNDNEIEVLKKIFNNPCN